MEPETITAISNTSEEYRRYAGILASTLEYLRSAGKEADEDDFRQLNTAADSLESEIRELESIAAALEEILATYMRAGNLAEGQDIVFDTAAGDMEFGISEFGNLSRHEKLMPIHSA